MALAYTTRKRFGYKTSRSVDLPCMATVSLQPQPALSSWQQLFVAFWRLGEIDGKHDDVAWEMDAPRRVAAAGSLYLVV